MDIKRCDVTCGTYHCEKDINHGGEHATIASIGSGQKRGYVKVLRWGTAKGERWIWSRVWL